MNDFFWQQMSALVLPALNRTVQVWMADTPNGASNCGAWPAPTMTKFPAGTVANIYQSLGTAQNILNLGYPIVTSIAGSKWYLDYHPTFDDVYKV